MSAPDVILASASPRRRTLLARVGLRFEVEPSDVAEDLDGPLEPEEAAVLLARRKALEIAGRHGGERRWVIGADTVVALPAAGGWRLLGKPADGGEARGMLASLSASTHSVVTGVCVVETAGGGARQAAETTRVTMRRLAPAEIDAYVASGEWADKAGGYAIQESADAFVTALEGGGFDNVVGLPVALTLRLLREAGARI